MVYKSTKIRVINVSKENVEINFSDIINGIDLSQKGIKYNYEGQYDEENKLEKTHLMRINSVNVIKSIDKFIFPKIDISDYFKPKSISQLRIDVPINIYPKDLKLVLNKINHIVVEFFHK